ncbi:MAG: molybdate ABC transporter substrate-binding protein, partial [Deinococcales bacterium]
SSLTDAFTALAHAYQAAHPGTHVELEFAASSTLATQILQGAPADVFASANVAQMRRVTDAGLQQGPATPFAGNRLAVLVPQHASIHTLADLARPGLLLVLAAPQVPAGHYAELMLDAAAKAAGYGPAFARAVRANVVSREPNVRQTAAKVALGAADAAIVYATDARGLGGVRAVPIPAALQPSIVYPLVALRHGGDPAGATAFRAFVLSPAGTAALASYGFTPPP